MARIMIPPLSDNIQCGDLGRPDPICVLQVISRLTLKAAPQDGSYLQSSEFALSISKNMYEPAYLGEDSLPTAIGSDASIKTLVYGLAANLHYAHQRGYVEDLEKEIYAICNELQRAVKATMVMQHHPFSPQL